VKSCYVSRQRRVHTIMGAAKKTTKKQVKRAPKKSAKKSTRKMKQQALPGSGDST